MKANITEWKMKLKEEEEKLQECEEEIKKKHEDADLAIVELACSSWCIEGQWSDFIENGYMYEAERGCK